jgi:hypothetical protein
LPHFSVFIGDELTEVGGIYWNAAQVGKARLHLGIGKAGNDLLVELFDDLDGRVSRRADGRTIPLPLSLVTNCPLWTL